MSRKQSTTNRIPAAAPALMGERCCAVKRYDYISAAPAMVLRGISTPSAPSG